MFRRGDLITTGGYVGRGPLISRPRNAFNPLSLPGLAAWYDASDAATVLTQVGGGTNFVAASSQQLTRASNASLQVGAGVSFSWSGWVKTGALVNDATYLSVWDFSTNQRVFRLINTASVLRFVVSEDGTNTTLKNADGAQSTGAWTFFVADYNASTNQISLSVNNGTPASTAANITATFSPALFFGVTNGSLGWVSGDMDEITFHKRVLTADERTFLFNSGAGRTYAEAPDSLKTNLVSWWSMNAPATGNWLDQHGTNHLTPSASRPTATTGVTFNVAQDGQTVRRWLDKSGNNRHLEQSDLANQPALNLGTGLYFAGASRHLVANNWGLNLNNFTVIFSANIIDDAGTNPGFLTFAPTINNDFNQTSAMTICAGGAGFGVHVDAGGGTTARFGLPKPAAQSIVSFSKTASGSFLRRNGVAGESLTNPTMVTHGGQLVLNARFIATLIQRFPETRHREMVIASPALSAADIEKVERYLSRKWGTPALP